MAKEGDMSLFNDVLEPFRRVINTDPPKDKLSASPKLNFSDSNQSLKEGFPNLSSLGKRKSSIGFPSAATPDKRARTDSTNSASALPSPWESKKMKIDLIAAKAQITKLEARVNHQHTIRKEMQILFEEERASLTEQHRRDERALTDMEDRLQVVRRRENDLKEELAEALKQQKQDKTRWDAEKADLQKQVADLRDKLLEADVSSKDQISEMKKDMDELLQALEGAQSEVEMLKAEVARQTSRAEQCAALRAQLDKQAFELQHVTGRLREIEYEKESYKDWQQQAKTASARLANMAALEAESARLRAGVHSLRAAAADKLLLEEQLHAQAQRLRQQEPQQRQLADAKAKLAAAESSLGEWVSAARLRGCTSARALAAALDAAHQHELAALSDRGQASSQAAQLTEEIATMRYERDKATAKLSDLERVRRSQESLIHRLQKRLLLVTRERDSYRQQLDSYERELNVTLSGEGGGAGGAALLAARVQQLEQSLQGHRDLLDKHEHDHAAGRVIDTLRAEVSKWRDEAESHKRDALKLKSQRDNLQTQLERLSVPADKVLHLTENPAALAQKLFTADLEAAQEEIKKLKEALRSGGGGGGGEDVAALKQQLDNSRIKLQRMKEEFTTSAQEYRDVCYMLLGYKIDRTGHKNYKLSNMFAESEDEYLLFTLCSDGVEMVHTEYSATLTDLVDLHLHQHSSIPLFLGALTFELFNRTTVRQEMHELSD